MSAALVVCPLCGSQSFGAPPHGEGQPCPYKLRLDEAYIAKLDAERMSSLRSASGLEGMSGAIRRLAGDDPE